MKWGDIRLSSTFFFILVDSCNVRFESKLKTYALYSIGGKKIVKPVTLINILVLSPQPLQQQWWKKITDTNKYRKKYTHREKEAKKI